MIIEDYVDFLIKKTRGAIRELLSEFHYLLMFMKLVTGVWENQLESMNMRVYEEIDKYMGITKRRVW